MKRRQIELCTHETHAKPPSLMISLSCMSAVPGAGRKTLTWLRLRDTFYGRHAERSQMAITIL